MHDQDDMDNFGRGAQLIAQAETVSQLEKIAAQQKNEFAGKWKCPWCAGPVEGNVFKCRHCTSDIAWVNVIEPLACRPQDSHALTQQEKKRLEHANEQVQCSHCLGLSERKNGKLIEGNFWCKECLPKYKPPAPVTDWQAFVTAAIFFGIVPTLFGFGLLSSGNTVTGIILLIITVIIVFSIYRFFTD